jgi:hypothetical protein
MTRRWTSLLRSSICYIPLHWDGEVKIINALTIGNYSKKKHSQMMRIKSKNIFGITSLKDTELSPYLT